MQLYKEKYDCCGCTACKEVCPKKAISMEYDEEGFLYPKIDKSKCIDCGMCRKVCPFKNQIENKEKNYPFVYAAKNKSDKIRSISSSGGMFFPLASHFIENKGVVYGCAYDENLRVKHIRCTSKEEVIKCCRSKYVQSDMNSIYLQVKKDLLNKKEVLFTGTPCQIMGLINYLGKMNKEKLFLIDIICHGVSSPMLFQDYLDFVKSKKKKNISTYYQRYKWKDFTDHDCVVFDDGKKDISSPVVKSWKLLFYSDQTLRPSCYKCPFAKTERVSDLTIADFWGLENYNPEFHDYNGVSLLLINNPKGEELLNNIKSEIELSVQKMEEAIPKNPHLLKPLVLDAEKRKDFWDTYYKYGFSKIAKDYGKYNYKSKIKYIIKKIIGKI